MSKLDEEVRIAAYLNWCGRYRPLGDDWTDWFAASKSKRDARIIHISDLHFTNSSVTWEIDGELVLWDLQQSAVRSSTIANYLINNRAKLMSNTIVITGDITDSGDEKDYAIAQSFISRLTAAGFRVFSVPGNHDVSYEGNLALFRVPFLTSAQQELGHSETRRQNFSKYIDNGVYPRIIDLQRAWLILLDTMKDELNDQGFSMGRSDNFGQGRLGQRQLEILKEWLRKFQNDRMAGKKVVVCLHHLFTSDSKIMLDDQGEFLEIVKGNIDCLLYGHSSRKRALQERRNAEEENYSIPIINCENLEHLTSDQPFYSITVIDLDQNRTEVFHTDWSEVVDELPGTTCLCTVAGRVIDVTTNQPIKGASVEARGTKPTFVTTDAAGRYVMGALLKGLYDVRATGTGWLAQEPSRGLDLQPGQTVTLDFHLAPGPPLGNIKGSINVLTGTVKCCSSQARPSSGGEYTLYNVPAGLQQVHASAPGYVVESRTVTVIERGTVFNVDFALNPNGRTYDPR
jgi:3',5'-cyclic AMP phosphodiesterase CpdA